MLKLEIIAGLRPEDGGLNWVYKRRNKSEDLDATRKYHEQFPPQVGDLVVVLHTSSQLGMLKPHVTRIDAMTDRGRIVVNHKHEGWAGKSFWKSGQNCMAPKGQCWLVPAELYQDIPLSRETDSQRRSEKWREKDKAEQLSLTEICKRLGGTQQFMDQAKTLKKEFGLSVAQSVTQLSRELKDEAEFSGRKNHGGKRINREMIRSHSRHFLRGCGGRL